MAVRPSELPLVSSVATPTSLSEFAKTIAPRPEPLYARDDTVFAMLATLAYDKKVAERCFRRNPTLDFFETRHLQAFAVKKEDEAYIAFRGTDNCHNWLSDFNFILIGRPLRHRGFQRAWDALKPKVYEWLTKHKPSTIFVTGHSLGSAIATIAAYDCLEQLLLKM
jgi:hypothetical protein